MFNVLLDKLPTEYQGFPIDSDFQTGIQILQVLEDRELTGSEKIGTALSLLFPAEDGNGNALPPPDAKTAADGLMWFLTEWNHDKHKDRQDEVKVTDYDVDQWRIYAAFRQHYGINLNNPGKLHFWEFMGLLTTLPECAYTRVVGIRAKKLTGNLRREERTAYQELKEIYALEQPEKGYTEEEKAAIDSFERRVREKKKGWESRHLAENAFKEMMK